jgi:predicted ArsR family transcriptional regulator
VESTRDQVLRLVRGRREVTVAQIAEALELSSQAVRRHLDGLRADGLLDARLVRHGVGRPALVFFATERGEEGRNYMQLLSRLVRQIDKMDGIEPNTDAGRRLLDRVFTGMAEEVVAEHIAEVSGATVAERVVEATRALEREGIVDGWRREDGVLQVINGECPYLRLAEMTPAPCSADQHVLELLLRVPVEQTKRIADGSPLCEYIVGTSPVATERGMA